jgi:CubicO group peptidase (beta-lactamase class C family)
VSDRTRPFVVALCVAVAAHATTLPPRLQAQEVATSPEARAARVERGLLPGIVIAGRPLPVRPLAERMAALKTPGVSVAVINGGVIEWAKGYGAAETGVGAPVTPQTLFQAASLSKPVAALAALRLVEQGKLALDQDVNERLTSWKVPENEFTKGEKVTLRRLLSHSAGLTVSGFPGYSAGAPVPELVQVLDGQKPANTAAIRADVVPGTIWRYAGGGYTVMQQLLMDVAGRPFPSLLAELVLRPLGMRTAPTSNRSRKPGARRGWQPPHRQASCPAATTYPEMAAAGLGPHRRISRIPDRSAGAAGRSNPDARMARQMVTIRRAATGSGWLEGAGPSAGSVTALQRRLCAR